MKNTARNISLGQTEKAGMGFSAAMRWENIVGHRLIISRLQRMIKTGRVPHALLFHGPAGVGKRLVADTLAAALLCDKSAFDKETGGNIPPCGDCESCRLIKSAAHPDLLTILPKGEKNKIIRIDDVREMILQTARVPVRGRRRVVIIDGADAMNEAAANSLLKTLEEPTGETFFLLVARRRAFLLPTILSRVTSLGFSALTDSEVRHILVSFSARWEKEINLDELSLLADGSVGRALALADDGGLQRRLSALDTWKKIKTPSFTPAEIFALGEELGKWPRSEIAEYLHFWHSFFHDLRRQKAKATVRNSDIKNDLTMTGADWPDESLIKAEKLTTEAKRRLLSSNATARLIIESLCFQLKEV